MPPRFPILRSLAAQLMAAAALAGLFYGAAALFQFQPSLAIAATAQGLLAAIIGRQLGLYRWWSLINFAFVPLLLLLITLNVPPWSFLAGFLILLLLNWNSLGGGVPLYLTGDATCRKVAELVGTRAPEFRFIDLGSGLGGTLCRLSRQFPKARLEGVETAPLVYLASRMRCFFRKNCHIRYESLWKVDLANYDVVYCFLSPVPMPDLWKKAEAEMRPNTLLISNTFEIPGVKATQIIAMNDWRGSRIFVWKM